MIDRLQISWFSLLLFFIRVGFKTTSDHVLILNKFGSMPFIEACGLAIVRELLNFIVL